MVVFKRPSVPSTVGGTNGNLQGLRILGISMNSVY